MVGSGPVPRDLDVLLHEAGAHWRARQVFEAVPLAPRPVRPYARVTSGLLIPAVGLAAVVVVTGAVIALGPLQFSGAGADATSSLEPGTSHPVASEPVPRLSPVELEAARLRVVEAVNTDPSNFGVPYLDGGTLVVPYLNEEARASVEAQVTLGLAVRWEKVEYSRTELRRIASEISDLRLAGVSGVSSGTSRNRVIVYVVPWGSVDEVRRAVAAYGAAVTVEISSDFPIVQPALPTAAS
jgi:hypothetical protein